MLRDYIRLAVRSIFSQGHQVVISSVDLSVALGCCILIILYVQYELSYDRFHENSGNIYRVINKLPPANSYMGKNTFAVTPAPLKEALINDLPGIEKSTKCKLTSHTLEYNSSLFTERGFLYADPDFLSIFSFPVISGNYAEDLNEPFTLYLTRKMAAKYFGNEEPVGKVIKVDNKYLFTVRGILEDIPGNSHLDFGCITGFETFYSMRGGREKVEVWDNQSYITYVQLAKNVRPEDIGNRLKDLPRKYMPDEPIFKDMQWVLVPLESIHLGGNANFDPANNSDMKYIFLVVSIGIFILLIACFNSMNMATARSYSRGSEVGILKVFGGSRTNLIMQFVTESVLISFGGLILALLIVWIVLPFFAAFVERPLTFRMIFEYSTLTNIILLTVLAGILAGIYPAIHLSSISPGKLIKEEVKNTEGKGRSVKLRNLLVTLQYIISLVALICTFTVLKQLNYIKKADTGFLRDNIITISIKDPAIRANPEVLINELQTYSDIDDITISSNLPHSITSASYCFWEGKPEGTKMTAFRAGVGCNFTDFYNLKIVSGRGFSKDFTTDSANSYILNQTAARMIGWDNPEGRKFGFNNASLGKVVGVIEDFNFQSLHLQIEPLAISLAGGTGSPEASYVSVKTSHENLNQTRTFIEKKLKDLSPHYLNPISFLGDQIDNMYRNDRKLSGIFVFATILALILTCLGQYSLSFFSAKSRTKEMVIRKIMGSQPSGIMKILTADMSKMIMVSVLFAWPIGYLLMTRWLQKFAFHAEIGFWIFLLSFLISFVISLIAISYNVIRLSLVNPAVVIRQN